jgi:V/A-type H+-transporting ATPase subunit I
VKLIGTPGRDETDPSGLLALIVPVLFGYMFGDVGHGAVLIVVGFLLRRRWPATAILIPAGLMAVIFGLVFGSVFAREDLLHPLWLNPLADPVSVLMAPFWGGAVLISLGLLLSGLAAHWSGDLSGWLRVEAGLLVAYLGALAALVETDAILVCAVGGFWYVTGSAYESPRGGLMGLLGGIGELAERLVQLAVNTVSFVRVGAFALAHAGLAMAVASLAAATGSTGSGLLVLVIGNLTILALEGLIVGIQTTRLVLFEFFVRFVRAEGREFRPLKPPLGVQITGAGV